MSKQSSLFPLYLSYLAPAIFATSFVAFYLLRTLSLSLTEFLLLLSITFGTGGLAASVRQSLSPRKAFTIASVVVVFEFLILAFPVHRALLYLYAVLYGLVLCFFWMVFNGAYFRQKAHEDNATRSAHYYAIPYILSVILPLVGIFAIERIGFTGLYLLGAAGMLVFLYMARRQSGQPLAFDGKSVWKGPTGYRALTVLEGAASALPLGVIPALSTLFFPTPQEFGEFTALMGLSSAAAMILLARHSDLTVRRKRFLIPLSVAGAFFLALALAAKDPYAWVLSNAAFGFTHALVSPLRNAVVLDKKRPPEEVMAHREVLLNAGRVGVLLISMAAVWSENPLWALAPGIAANLGYAGMAARKQGIL